jgi:PKD repeat protein
MKKLKNSLVYILLLVLSIYGCTNDETSDTKETKPPIADFSYTSVVNSLTTDVTFSNRSKNAYSYIWNFGDGTFGSDENAKHTYTKGGTYSVVLMAVGENSITDRMTKSVVIQKPNPVAGFEFLTSNEAAPTNVTFVNSTTDAETYSWDFGDGQTSTLENPYHLYTEGGVYKAKLVASDSKGKQSQVIKDITINNVPKKLIIKSIVLTALPNTFSDGSQLLNYDGIKITDSSGTMYFESSYVFTYTNSMPVTYDTRSLEFTQPDYQYRIQVWEWYGTEKYIGGYYFKVRDWMQTDGKAYPKVLKFSSPSSGIKFSLNVDWQ